VVNTTALASLPLGKIPGTHCTRDWVGWSVRVQKISSPMDFDPWTIQLELSMQSQHIFTKQILLNM
jgi:hypothetical protein